MGRVPRLRMFAGPNGSGKSTFNNYVPSHWRGSYINPDEIERLIRERGYFAPSDFSLVTNAAELHDFLGRSTLLQKAALTAQAEQLRFEAGRLLFDSVAVNSYFAAVLADFVRRKLLQARRTFTFETVMSSPDKVKFLRDAQNMGYRTYLYYVATKDPAINIERVQTRVQNGGHNVPEDKIVSRYYRSLSLLREAIRYSNRAYLFDNSGAEMVWLAEITDGKELEFKSRHVPKWVMDAVNSEE